MGRSNADGHTRVRRVSRWFEVQPEKEKERQSVTGSCPQGGTPSQDRPASPNIMRSWWLACSQASPVRLGLGQGHRIVRREVAMGRFCNERTSSLAWGRKTTLASWLEGVDSIERQFVSRFEIHLQRRIACGTTRYWPGATLVDPNGGPSRLLLPLQVT